MFCPRCGATVGETDHYCRMCGLSLRDFVPRSPDTASSHADEASADDGAPSVDDDATQEIFVVPSDSERTEEISMDMSALDMTMELDGPAFDAEATQQIVLLPSEEQSPEGLSMQPSDDRPSEDDQEGDVPAEADDGSQDLSVTPVEDATKELVGFPGKLSEDATQALELLSPSTSDDEQRPELTMVASSDPDTPQTELEDELADGAEKRMEHDAAAPDKGGRHRALIAIVVAIVIAVCIGGWLLARQLLDAWSWKKAHESVAVNISLHAPSYNSETDSPIPLRLTGTDVDGDVIDRTVFINGAGEGIQVIQGTYQVSCTASPMLSGGKLYELPRDVLEFQVTEDGVQSENLTLVYAIESPEDVTDTEINNAYQAALASGMSVEQASALRDDVVKARQKARGVSSSTLRSR
jgi:hypothetical protein